MWPSKASQPATARCLQLLPTADDVERPARLAVVDRQRQPVVALLGDHPVAHVEEPVQLPLVAEARDPPDPVHDLHDLVAKRGVHLRLRQLVPRPVVDLAHADVPLVNESEQERRAAAPAVRIAVAVRLDVVEEPPLLEVGQDRLADVGGLAPAQPVEPRVVPAVLVDRPDHRQADLATQLVVLRTAARGDVDDPGPLLLADLGPGDHAVLVARLRERLPDRRQLVERTRVPPAGQLRPGPLLHDLEWSAERLLQGSLAHPEVVAALAHLDVAQVRANGGGDVRGQRPGRRRPDQERLAGPVHQREPHREPWILAVLVALVHLHLGQAGPAPRAPRHGVVAAVDPAALVALGQEAPDEVVVLVAEREVGTPDVRHAQAPHHHLDGVGHGSIGALDRHPLGRVLLEQVTQPEELCRVVPVHPVAEPDALLRLACREGEHALLAQAHELGDPERLDVALALEVQVPLDVDLDPQALAVEAVLVALVLAEHRVEALEEVLVGAAPGVMDAHGVVGRDRAVEEAPARVARVLRAEARERPALSPFTEQVVLLGDEVGSGADGTEHRASLERRRNPWAGRGGPPVYRQCRAGRVMEGRPRPRSRTTGIIPRDVDSAAGASLAVRVRRGLPVAALPRPGSCVRGSLCPCARVRGCPAAGPGPRWRGGAALGSRPARRHGGQRGGADRHLHRQSPRARVPGHRGRRRLAGRPVPQRLRRWRQRAPGPRPDARQSPVDRRPGRRDPGHRRGPRRRGAL